MAKKTASKKPEKSKQYPRPLDCIFHPFLQIRDEEPMKKYPGSFIAVSFWMLIIITAINFGGFRLYYHRILNLNEATIKSLENKPSAEMAERHLSDKEKDDLISEFKKIADKLSGIELGAVGHPEAIQYAMEFKDILEQAGVKNIQGEFGSSYFTPARIEALDMDTLGVLIGTKDENRPSQKAIDLKTALKNSKIEAKYSTHYGIKNSDAVALSISFRN